MARLMKLFDSGDAIGPSGTLQSARRTSTLGRPMRTSLTMHEQTDIAEI